MRSFTYFTSQTNLNSNQNIKSVPLKPSAEFYDYFVIMIPLIVIVYLIYHCPKRFSLLGLVKLLFLKKHKSLCALLKLMIKQFEEFHKLVSAYSIT